MQSHVLEPELRRRPPRPVRGRPNKLVPLWFGRIILFPLQVLFFSFLLNLLLSYKKWKADELYIKMAHIAYCENLIDFSITLFKMARFEKQTFFFLLSILKM